MITVSEIISKPILNLYTGKIEGTIHNVVFSKDYKKIQQLKIFDNDEEEYLIDTCRIYSIGSNSIVIKNSEPLYLNQNQLEKEERNPINQMVFNINGDSLGRLVDIELNEKFETQKFICSDKSFTYNNLVNVGENIIINTTNKKIKLNNLKPKKPNDVAIASNQNVIILPKITPPTIEHEVNIDGKEKKVNFKLSADVVPQKLITNSNFLIGRKALKTIYGINNEIIVKKDCYINEKNLQTAKKHSKLIELTVYSKAKN